MTRQHKWFCRTPFRESELQFVTKHGNVYDRNTHLDSKGCLGLSWKISIRKIFCFQGVKRNIPHIFQIVSCVSTNITCKFHDNPFIFSVMLLKKHDAAPNLGIVKQSIWAWKTLGSYFLCYLQHIQKKIMEIHVPVFSVVLLASSDPANK